MPVDPAFWLERWSTGNTPWHQCSPNARLREHFDALDIAPGAEVLVPLCGKAVDMRWLLERRFRVLGVELSEAAVRAFFEENGLRVHEGELHGVRIFEGDRVRILCADVFALGPEHLRDVAAVYDRAALIALDEPDQARYAALLDDCLPAGASQLLVTFEYDTECMQGPPFSVGEARVRALYAGRYRITRLASGEILDEEPHLRARGLEQLTEHAFALVPGTQRQRR